MFTAKLVMCFSNKDRAETSQKQPRSKAAAVAFIQLSFFIYSTPKP